MSRGLKENWRSLHHSNMGPNICCSQWQPSFPYLLPLHPKPSIFSAEIVAVVRLSQPDKFFSLILIPEGYQIELRAIYPIEHLHAPSLVN
ncbi:hypothetical protein NC653_041121 [Populus alba x Populus x berolinensis]|uniref:Uncharacterized protein n=1 Tax=Populus alba x Populus x berolinensis TaxID=444605 RepID=A0AAD6L976_9ROSI|nr:hypothetical protein NC653_041121 [Populus alba x Populus x berolinensis]